jgi:pimeloyl-ACP methyl ester carboxylesterase/DNA-binding CsgD family transcriptional regulator
MLAVVRPPPGNTRGRTAVPQDEAGSPTIRTATDSLGRRVAWSATGSGGPAVVAVSGWLTHLLLGWRNPASGGFFRELCAERRLLRYDRPGVGLSQGTGEVGLEQDLAALEAVIAASGEDRVALLAFDFGGPAAIELAIRRPELVSHLVLVGASALPLGDASARVGLTPALAEALEGLILAEWGLASRALADLMLPDAELHTLVAYAEHQRAAAGAESAAAILRAHRDVDVRDRLALVAAPTLVLHRRDDRAIPVRAAQLLAARIPGARMELLDGSEHPPFFGDARPVLTAVGRFLNPAVTLLTAREIDVLEQIGEGVTNLEAGQALGVSEATVARHLANIYLKLDVTTRGAAVARGRRSGLL